MKALIFAAGKGTRLKPFTDSHPKALIQVNGVPLLERNIKYLQSFGINDFVINIHHFGEQIVKFLEKNDNFQANISISDEKETLLETGGGLLFAQKFLENEENFLIMNADILTDLKIDELINEHETGRNFVTLAVSDRKSSRKLLFNDDKILRGWLNVDTGEQKLAEFNKAFKPMAFSGIHCLNHSIFNKIKRRGKFSIMEEYLDLMKTDLIKGFYHDANLIDVGKPEAVATAEKIFK
ncbi:nucleotidyltransferase family protein [Halpernia frigidisoli]|uniref:Nucleotidyl transferase n=1 Tax=Halpernia frigidisoli TaxID=1125876 RepID=A0A1I3HK24_9FLAO|nr:sugar phosphate nucleotidyltransferase [Halpernia frigidisoli]SFI36032.1 Nucleotidyl transferase [Halpernia frigidisoli]